MNKFYEAEQQEKAGYCYIVLEILKGCNNYEEECERLQKLKTAINEKQVCIDKEYLAEHGPEALKKKFLNKIFHSNQSGSYMVVKDVIDITQNKQDDDRYIVVDSIYYDENKIITSIDFNKTIFEHYFLDTEEISGKNFNKFLNLQPEHIKTYFK